MNSKISKLKAERAKNDGKIAMLQSRNREIDEDIIKLENEDIVGLARATGMTMEELAQNNEAAEFGHTLEEQLQGQMAAGFVLTTSST